MKLPRVETLKWTHWTLSCWLPKCTWLVCSCLRSSWNQHLHKK